MDALDPDEQVELTLERAEAAWLDGDDIGALRELETLGPDHPRGKALEVVVWAYSGYLTRARLALEVARGGLRADDPERLFAEGLVEHFAWAPDAARPLFERLLGTSPSATLLQLLSVCADLQEDYAAGDRYLRAYRAEALDGAATLVRMGPDAFHREVHAAAEQLPDGFRDALETVPVIIDPMPSAELGLCAGDESLPPELLGLFVGVSDLDKGAGAPDEPRRIYLFQRNLEREAHDLADLREQIRVTLYHELGHALGFDEDGVAELGLA